MTNVKQITYNYRLGTRDSEWIRVLASQLVLIHHLNPWASQLLTLPYMNVLDFLGANYSVGWFWVYSGYVFDSVYNNVHNRSSKKFSALDFFLKRVRRLYPLHIITLAIILTLNSVSSSSFGSLYTWDSVVLNFMLLQNIFGGGSEKSINPVMWSVSLELVAYAVFYFWVRYFSGTRIWSIVILVGCLVICKFIGYGQNSASALCLFFGGTILSWLYQGNKSINQIVTLVVGSLIVLCIGYKFATFAPLFVIAIMSLFVASGFWIKSNSLCQFLADRTYTLYVTHTLVIWGVTRSGPNSQYSAAIMYFLSSWCLSILIDQPLLKELYSRCLLAFNLRLTSPKSH